MPVGQCCLAAEGFPHVGLGWLLLGEVPPPCSMADTNLSMRLSKGASLSCASSAGFVRSKRRLGLSAVSADAAWPAGEFPCSWALLLGLAANSCTWLEAGGCLEHQLQPAQRGDWG